MKRATLFILAIWFLAWTSVSSASAQSGCTRENLKGITNKYFSALEAQNPSSLPISPNAKYTENGADVEVGNGIWKTAQKTLLKWSIIDAEKCGTHSMSVLRESDRPILFGVRLKLAGDQIIEMESIIAREKEFAFEMGGAKEVLKLTDQDWESILPVGQRSSRLALIAAADDYFDMFAKEPIFGTPFSKPCHRWENGFQTTKGGEFQGMKLTEGDCSPKGLEITTHGPRRFLVDVEQGVVVAYVLFAGGLPDFHMFKMRNGRVDMIQAVVGAGSKAIGWPIEPVCK